MYQFSLSQGAVSSHKAHFVGHYPLLYPQPADNQYRVFTQSLVEIKIATHRIQNLPF